MEERSASEMERLLEEARKRVQAMLDRMTPEERAEAERKARAAQAADEAERQRLVSEAAALVGKPAPQRCPHCGAAAQGGNFCACCGQAL